MANTELKFNPLKSKTAMMLINMSNEMLYRRYFIKNPTKVSTLSQDLYNDFNTYVDDSATRKSNFKYPLIASLMGVNLDEFATNLAIKVDSILCADGLKLNSTRVCDDFEAILSENIKETTRSSTSNVVTDYIKQINSFLTKLLIKRAYLQENDNIFNV